MSLNPDLTIASSSELVEALDDARVAKALRLALRDARLRAQFAALRADGASVEDAVNALRGPHEDDEGRPYFLSEERVRAVVYRKGGAG